VRPRLPTHVDAAARAYRSPSSRTLPLDLPPTPGLAIPVALHFSRGGGGQDCRWWWRLGWAASVMARSASLWPKFRRNFIKLRRERLDGERVGAKILARQLLLCNKSCPSVRRRKLMFLSFTGRTEIRTYFFMVFARLRSLSGARNRTRNHKWRLFYGWPVYGLG
jgi:hypothetical protein